MLIRDGEQLNLNKKSEDLNETELWVKEELKAISDSGKIHVFKATMKPMILKDDHGREHVDHRNITAPTESQFHNPRTGLTENWQLLTNPGSFKRLADGTISVRREPAMRIPTDGKFFDCKKHTEIIFFLKHISSLNQKRWIILEDKEAEAKKRSEELMEQDMALNIISNPTSHISEEVTGSLEVMRQLATAWGVGNASALTPSELKLNLREAVIRSNKDKIKTQRGFKEFIEDAARLGDSEKRSNIMLGIEREILYFEDNVWFLKMRDSSQQFLRAIPPNDEAKKNDWIIRFLAAKENKSFYELLEGILKNPTPERVIPKDKKELLRICKDELGWPHNKVFNKNEEQLYKIVKNNLKPDK